MSHDKALFKEMLNTTANVEEQSQGRDAQNQIVTTWSVKIADMPCRIQKLNPNDRFSYAGQGGQGDSGVGEYTKTLYKIYAEIDNNIINTDRIVSGGKTFEIIDLLNDSSFNHYELVCKVIES